MDKKVLDLLEMAGRETTPDGEAVNALRALRRVLAGSQRTFESLLTPPARPVPPNPDLNTPFVEWKRRLAAADEEVRVLKLENIKLKKENASFRGVARQANPPIAKRQPQSKKPTGDQHKPAAASKIEKKVRTRLRFEPPVHDFSAKVGVQFRTQLYEVFDLLLKRPWANSDQKNVRTFYVDPVRGEHPMTKLTVGATGLGMTIEELTEFASHMVERSKTNDFLSLRIVTRRDGAYSHVTLKRPNGPALLMGDVVPLRPRTTADHGEINPLESTRYYNKFGHGDFTEVVFLGSEDQDTAKLPYKTQMSSRKSDVLGTLFALYFDPRKSIVRHGGKLLDIKVSNPGTNTKGLNLCASGHKFQFMFDLVKNDGHCFAFISDELFDEDRQDEVMFRFYQSAETSSKRNLYRTCTVANGERIALIKDGRMFNVYEDKVWLNRIENFGISRQDVSVMIHLPDDYPCFEVDGVLYSEANDEPILPEEFIPSIRRLLPSELSGETDAQANPA